jgi:hypothetical protein
MNSLFIDLAELLPGNWERIPVETIWPSELKPLSMPASFCQIEAIAPMPIQAACGKSTLMRGG